MNLAMNEHRLTKPGPQNAALRDYDSVRRAIEYISRALARPARHRADRAFRRRDAGRTASPVPPLGRTDAEGLHAGADPRPRQGSCAIAPACSTPATSSGLSGPGRLHDLFVTHEAMSPGEWKTGGAGMTLRYGFHPSPFGTGARDRERARARGPRLRRSRRRAGRARRHAAALAAARPMSRTAPAPRELAQRVFDPKLWRADQPLRVVLIGTDFEVRVWETLLKIPMGRAVCYSDIASKIRSPKAVARGRRRGRQEPDLVRGAVPSRARQVRRADRLSLGLTRKQAMLGWEAGQVGRAVATNTLASSFRASEATKPDPSSPSADKYGFLRFARNDGFR